MTEVRPANVKLVAPRAIEVDPTVTEELVNPLFGMFVNVFVEPDIDLFVNVWVPVRVATFGI